VADRPDGDGERGEPRFAFARLGFGDDPSWGALIGRVIGTGIGLTLIVAVHEAAHDRWVGGKDVVYLAAVLSALAMALWLPVFGLARLRHRGD